MGAIDLEFMGFALQQFITHLKMVLFLLIVIIAAQLLNREENRKLNSFLREKDIISFEFNGRRIVIDLRKDESDRETEEYESVDEGLIESQNHDSFTASPGKEEPLDDWVTSTSSSVRSVMVPEGGGTGRPEIIENKYKTNSTVVETLNSVKDRENTLINDIVCEDKTITEAASMNDALDSENKKSFEGACAGDLTGDLDPILPSSYSTSVKSLPLFSDSYEPQLPVKDLILRFESISSNSSINSADNSFLNKNILNNGHTKSNETIIAKKFGNNTFDDIIIEEVDSLCFSTPEKEAAYETKTIKNEILNSVSSKASSNMFFTPYIQSSLTRSPAVNSGSNFLVFKDEKNLKAAALACLMNIEGSCSYTKAVATQEVVVNGTIITPDKSFKRTK